METAYPSNPLNPLDPTAYGAASVRYATFWERLGAYLIDSIIVGMAFGILSMIFGGGMMMGAMGSDPADPAAMGWMSGGFAGIMLMGLLVGILYFPIMESSAWQATIGKKALGLVVTDEQARRIGFGRALGRYFSKFISSIILYIGFLMILWTAKKQGLHDQIAGTLVAKR